MHERIEQVKKYIIQYGEVKLIELEKMFPDISSMTLRRDLEKLERMGEVVRTRGGAKSISHLSRIKEELFSTRAGENVEAKMRLAKKASEFISQGRSVYLDSGSTIMYLSQFIDDERLFITTSAPNIALECAKNTSVDVYLIGGYLNKDNLTLSGMNALSFLENINIDVAFMATSGFSGTNAFTCGNFDECQIKKKVIAKAGKVVMLMDSSKVGKNLPFTFAGLEDINYLIIDEPLSRELTEEITKYDIGVIKA